MKPIIDETLISIPPEDWELIKAGKKTIVLFRNKPTNLLYPMRVFVYTLLHNRIIGCFDCDSITLTIRPEQFAAGCGMTEEQLIEYACGKPLCGWHIKEGSVHEYEAPLELERATGRKTPPKTWEYLRRNGLMIDE